MKTWVIALLVLTTLVIGGGYSSSSPEVSAAFAPATDASGSGTRIASALGWGPPTVLESTPPHCALGTSLATIGGNPALSYMVFSDQGSTPGFTVYFARANDPTGTSWGNPVAVTFWPYPYDYDNRTSLREVNGKPAIAYMSFPNGMMYNDVRFVRAKDPAGNKWGTPVIVDPYDSDLFDYQGSGTTLEMVNGNPAVWYKDGGWAKYVRSLDQSGSNWGSPQIVGRMGSFHIVNGHPVMMYSDSGVLYFHRAADANGDSWLDPVSIGYGGGFGSFNIVNGQPAVTYSDSGELYYCRAADANGDSWGAPVDLGYNNGFQHSFAIVNGQPAVTYSDGSGVLYFRRAADANGDSWGSTQTALTDAAPADQIRLAVVDGCPAIAFSGNSANPVSSVRIIRALDAAGTTWPSAAVDVTVGGDASVEWLHSVVFINGLPSIFFFSGVNEAVNSPPDPPAYSNHYLNFVQALDSSGSAWETPDTVYESGSATKTGGPLMTISGSGAGVAFTSKLHALNFVGSLPAPPSPAVNVQLSTDKSGYIIGQDTQAVLTAVVTDENGYPISGLGAGAFATTLDGGGLMVAFSESATAGTYSGTLDISGLSAGDHTVQTTVSDTRGIQGSDSATFSMNEPGTGGTMHVGDLDASIDNGPHNRWRATFTVKIDDSSHNPVGGADVSFSLSGVDSGNGQVTTGDDGTASYQTGWIKSSGDLTFTVNDVTHATLSYSAADNHDPDGDSDGTSITTSGP